MTRTRQRMRTIRQNYKDIPPETHFVSRENTRFRFSTWALCMCKMQMQCAGLSVCDWWAVSATVEQGEMQQQQPWLKPHSATAVPHWSCFSTITAQNPYQYPNHWLPNSRVIEATVSEPNTRSNPKNQSLVQTKT